MVWNDQLKREIPNGWEVLSLYEIEKNIITGKTPSTKDPLNFGGNIPFITIPDIRNNTYIISTEKTLSYKGANLQSNKFIPADSICVSCIASPGLVGFSTHDSQTNQQINTVICKNEYNRYYLFNSLKHYFDNSSAIKTGNTFSNMNKEEFSSINILYSTKLVKKYANKVRSIYRCIKNNSLENAQLVEIRNYLLPLLMNGQITIE